MTIIERAATLLMLLPAAIWAGIVVFYAVERVNLWARMPVEQFAVDFRRSVHRADPLQPILAIATIIGSAIFAVNSGGLASAFAWVGAGIVAAVIAFSIAVPERINSEFRRRAEGDAPPHADSLRARWRLLHWIRTVPTVAALVSLILATTFA